MDLAIGVPFKSVSDALYAGEVVILYGSRAGLTGEGSQVFNQDVDGVAGEAGDDDQFSHYSLTVGDFNGDTYGDLVVGVHNEDRKDGEKSEANNTGAINIFYGSANGLTVANNQVVTQDTPGMSSEATPEGHFGQSATAGDYNGDGYTDLAVGIHRQTINTVAQAGAVNILLGSTSGITTTGNYLISQDTPGVAGASEPGDAFGQMLGAWDINGDGFTDLVIGKQMQQGELINAESLALLFQLAIGNYSVAYQSDIFQLPERIAHSLVVADFTNDQRLDVAFGIPTDGDVELGLSESGAVDIYFGAATGFTARTPQTLQQDEGGVDDVRETGDRFGQILAAGDFEGDGYSDLVVGIPGESRYDVEHSGAVQVFWGSDNNVRIVDNQIFDQESDGLPTVLEPDDGFGSALAVGDFNGDGYSDLAVGTPFDNVRVSDEQEVKSGSVNIYYGSEYRLTPLLAQNFAQGVDGIAGESKAGEQYGAALASGDFNHDGYFDLAVGIPLDSSNTLSGKGAVNIIYGSAAGLIPLGNQIMDQETENVIGIAQPGDQFGRALTAGDFNQDGYFDLAVGVPQDGNADSFDRGVVNILYGSPSGITATGSQIFDEDSQHVAQLDASRLLMLGAENALVTNAEATYFAYGSAEGITATSDEVVDRDTAAVMGGAEIGDRFSHGLR